MLVKRVEAEALMCSKKTVDLGDVDPSKKMRVVGRVGDSVGGDAAHSFVNCTHAVDSVLGGDGRTKGCGCEKIGSALQATPRIVAVIGMRGDACHGDRMQRLEKKCAQSADEHRRIAVHTNDRAVFREPTRTWLGHHLFHSLPSIGAGDATTHGVAQGLTQLFDAGGNVHHAHIVPAYASVMPSPAEEKVGSTRWLVKAVSIFWVGFLVMVATRYSFHRLTNLLLLLLVSIFLSLAIEPGVNRLERRGWRRGRATISILLSVVIGAIAIMTLFGTLVANQMVDLLRNSEHYVSETVKFVNDTFNANIDPKEVNDKIADPNGPVQRFINAQQDKVVSVSVKALGFLLQAFSVLLFTFYFVADGPKWRRIICSRLAPDRQVKVLNGWEIAVDKTGGYLYSRALLALISSFFHWIAFQAIGTPAPIAMAIWVGLISQFLPVIGTYVAGVLPLLLSFINKPASAIFVAGFVIIYQQLENYLFAPRITARTMDLHPALAFGSAIAGAAVLGPVGAILALPGAAMIQAIAAEWGTRHEVVTSPLTTVAPIPEKKRRSRNMKRGTDG